jgi:hypothetical protein
MKTITMCCFAMFLAACAMQNAPPAPSNPDPVCGDNACEGNEDHANCPADCDADPTAPVCGNNVCEPGETSASCWDDCDNGDLTCDPAKWAARSVKDDIRFAVKIWDQRYDDWYQSCPGTPTGDGRYYATIVGECATEGLGWPHAQGKRIYRNASDTEWVYNLVGAPQECHVTLMDCNVPVTERYEECPGGPTWAAYLCPDSPVGVDTETSGPYVWYGFYHDDPYMTGHVAFMGVPNGASSPRGILSCGP